MFRTPSFLHASNICVLEEQRNFSLLARSLFIELPLSKNAILSCWQSSGDKDHRGSETWWHLKWCLWSTSCTGFNYKVFELFAYSENACIAKTWSIKETMCKMCVDKSDERQFYSTQMPRTFSNIQDMQVNGVLISSSSVTIGRKWPSVSHTTVPTYPARAKKWCVASGRSNDRNATLEPWRATFSNTKKPVAVRTLNHDQSSCPLTLSLANAESSVRVRRPATVLWIPNAARVAARFQKTFSLANREL